MKITQQQPNPTGVEYNYNQDEFNKQVDNIDDILQAQDPFGQEDFDHHENEGGKNKHLFDGITKAELEDMEDDDAIIEFFLNHPDRFTAC